MMLDVLTEKKRPTYSADIEDQVGLVGWVWRSNDRQSVYVGGMVCVCAYMFMGERKRECAQQKAY